MTSYLKYMEQVSLASDDTDPAPTEETNLQRVYIVEAIDGETGEPWYPDPPEPEVEPLEVDQPAQWVTTGDFRPNQTIKALTATFTGGRPPLKLYSRFRIKRPNGDLDYSPKFNGHPNTPTEISWVIPSQVTEVIFYTVAADTPSPSREEEDVALSATDPHAVIEDLIRKTPISYSSDNTYRIGESFKVYSADFEGGSLPVTVDLEFKYRTAGSNVDQYGSTWLGLPNEVTYRSWTPPSNAARVNFFTTARDSAGQWVETDGGWRDIVQPSITVVQQPPDEISDGPIAHRVDFVAQGEYTQYYQWQFTDRDGNWHDLSQSAVAFYYPQATYSTFSGESSCCFQWKKMSGKHFQFLRCKVFDYKSGISSPTITSNIVELIPI